MRSWISRSRSFVPCFAVVSLLGCETTETPIDAGGDAYVRSDAPLPERDAAVGCASEPCLHWTVEPSLPAPASDGAAAIAVVGGSPVLVFAGGADLDIMDNGPYSRGVATSVIGADGHLAPFTAVTPLVSPISFWSAVSDGERIYAIGGAGQRTLNTRVQVGTPSGGGVDVVWTQLEGTTAGRVTASSARLDDTHIAMIGGYDDVGATVGVFVLDLATGTWADGAPLPSGRAFVSVTSHDGRIYVIGGTDGASAAVLDEVLVSVSDGSGAITGWDVATTLPDAPYGGLAFVLTHEGAPYLFVTGGHVGMTIDTQVLRSAIAADGSLGAFVESGEDMPLALARAAVATHDGRVYLVGGKERARYRSTDVVISGGFQ